MNPPSSRPTVALACVLLAATACAPRSEGPPEVGVPRGFVPDLRGAPVMVMPVQSVRGVRGTDLDAEIAYRLRERAPRVQWVLPEELRAAIRRAPGLQVDVDNLPVGAFLQREVLRIGDPLYGELRRAAALTNARLALIPVEVRHRPEGPGRPEAVEVVGALVDARTGRVPWFAILEGAPGAGDDASAAASAIEALARALTGG